MSSLPWVNDLHGWMWSIKSDRHQNRTQAVKINRRDLWSLEIFEQNQNISQMRSVLTHLMRGMPGTWFRDTSIGTDWSYDNWYGALAVCVDPRASGYTEQFQNPNNLQTVLSVGIRLVAI